MTKPSQLLLITVLAGLALFVHADEMKMPMAKPAMVNVATHHAVGVVKQVNGNTVLIAHGAIQSLGWPPMTMPFAAKDKRLLAGLKDGVTVDFDFVQEDGKSILTGITRK